MEMGGDMFKTRFECLGGEAANTRVLGEGLRVLLTNITCCVRREVRKVGTER